MSATDDYVANSAQYPATYTAGLPAPPARQVAVVTCMDARLDVNALLGIRPGEAHVLRNAGGVISEDVLRSLAISQRALGTREIIVINHTQCGLLGFDDEGFRAEIQAETGEQVQWQPHTLGDLDSDLRRAIAFLRGSRALAHTESVRGFVFDVADGSLREVHSEGG